MTYSPDQLHNAIESGLASGDADVSALVRLARRLFHLQPAGPSREASRRMAMRFEAVMAGEKPNRWAAWLPFGATDARRPSLVQKFAAGALALSAVGGATSVATGVTPVEAARTAIRVVASATANLAPHTIVQELTSPDQDAAAAATVTNDEPGNAEAAPSTPESSTTPIAGVATSPGGSPETETPGTTTTPIPSGTPTPSTSGNAPPPPTPTPTSPGTIAPAFPPSSPANTTTPPPTSAPAGTQTPTTTPTPSPSPSSTPTPTPTQTPTATPTPHEEDDDEEDEDGPEPTETPEPPEREEDHE